MTRSSKIALRVAIVGSGFAEIGMAIRLRQMGVAELTVYEAESLESGWRSGFGKWAWLS